MPTAPSLSIVIPIYNEETTLRAIAHHVALVPFDKEIILVDDGSTDATRTILQEFAGQDPFKVIYHEKNCGKGAAIATGIAQATKDLVLVQDADLEYHPRDYAKLIRPFVEADADVVYGSRFRGADMQRILYFWHWVGNALLTLFSNMLSNLNLTDMETGYKVFRRELIQRIRLTSQRFGFEPEVTAKVSKAGAKIYEVAISYRGREYKEGKKITWRDGCTAIWHILHYNLFPGKIFKE